MNRRHFVMSAATAAGSVRVFGANDRIRIGLIGAGERGTYVSGIAARQPGAEIVTVCDVYEPRRTERAAKYGAECKPVLEYREVLDRKDVDAVIIGAPDHWHVPIAVAALNAGKDVYCEKPVTHRIEEGETLIAAVDKNKRVFQSGLQQRSWPHYIQAKQDVEAGKLGRLYFAQAYWYFVMPKHGYVSGEVGMPTVDKAKLDWKRFLGSAPDQAFDPHKFFSWRSYWDFGGGGFDDFMTHWIDVVQWFMGQTTPVTVEASGIWEPAFRGDVPATMSAVMQYPDNNMATYDGSYMAANHESGILFRGTEASMMLTRSGYTISRTGSPLLSHRMRTPTNSEVMTKQDGTIDNVQNWLDCIRSRELPKSNVRVAVEAAQTSHMANLAAWRKQGMSGVSKTSTDTGGFQLIFNGRDLSGWHISKVNHHGATQSWHVENGAIVGTQDPPGVGGILLTDRKYRNFEVMLELNPDWDCDSGLFLRSNEKGQAYQVMLDYLSGGNVGGIYGEGLSGVRGQMSKGWQNYWKARQWNHLRARIEGDAPHIQVWLNGNKITDWTDTESHLPGGATDGMIAVQVHLGNRWAKGGWHRFRNIMVKEL